MARVLIITITLVSFFAALSNGEPDFGDPHLCNRTIFKKRYRTVEEPVKYELEYSSICGILPCTKTRVETRMDQKLVRTVEEVNVPTCCEGYAENPARKCAPICLKACGNGECVAPGQCKCDPEPSSTSPGFVGPQCNRFTCLASNRWGAECDRECNCSTNSYCSASTGKCICRAGWRGANCTEVCDSSMDCDNFELPPIVEPDANIISESAVRSPDLENMSRALLRAVEDNEDQSASATSYNLSTFNVTLVLFLLSIIGYLTILLTRMRYQNQIRNEIYHAPSSTSSPGSGYAPSSYYSNAMSVQNRPRMPTPPEANLSDKCLNFDSATRYILLNGNPSLTSDNKVIDSKVEAHLISSKEPSKQNLYSDIDQFTLISKPVLNDQMLRLDMPSLTDATSHYSVPKSPANRVVIPHEISSSNVSSDPQNQAPEGQDQNLYEEIKPRSTNNEL